MRHFIIEMVTAPSSPLCCCIYAPIYAALGSVLLFLLERTRTRQRSSLKKIYVHLAEQNSPSLSLALSLCLTLPGGVRVPKQRGC